MTIRFSLGSNLDPNMKWELEDQKARLSLNHHTLESTHTPPGSTSTNLIFAHNAGNSSTFPKL